MFGASFDTAEDNAKLAAAQGFTYPLLCDTDRALVLAFGAAESATDAYPRRCTFVVGADGQLERVIDTQDPVSQARDLLQDL